jgi:hypothetical protein
MEGGDMKIELGDIAETLAAKHIIGEKTNSDFLELLKYYPKNDADEFKNCWCCVFVYHCCRKAGVDLPLGTHKTARKGHFRWFTSVLTWFEWAQINGFIHKESPDYVPIRGDIVIYNNIIPDEYKQKDSLWCDHIGIVLSADGDTLMVAEGNINNQNISGIVQRNRDDTIGYYIRIPEDYISDEFLNIPWNVYFIWGSGKTTTANELARRFGCYVYHTDNSRSQHVRNANPKLHPPLCRVVPDIWTLDPEDARQWERDIVREMTPMIIADLAELAAQYKIVICEGDIDVDIIAPLTANIVYITNKGKSYDFFDRPEQRNMLDDIRNRTDLTDAEKEQRVQNAYAIVSGAQNNEPPLEIIQLGVKEIVRDENTVVEQTADAIAEYFGFEIWFHGSPFVLTELAPGSAITQWKALAEAFSHKPSELEYDNVGGKIKYNGTLPGYLYVIDELITEDVDIYRHPNSSMDDAVEWLTKRPLKLRQISSTTNGGTVQ